MTQQDAAIDIDAGVEDPLLNGAGAGDGSDFSGWTVPGALFRWAVVLKQCVLLSRQRRPSLARRDLSGCGIHRRQMRHTAVRSPTITNSTPV